MEVIMSSSVQECSQMEHDNGNDNGYGNCAAKLTKSQRRKGNRALKKKLHANMVSKEHDDTEVSNGKRGASETRNLDVKSPQNLQNMEAVKGETGLGATKTGSPASKKRKREKTKNKNSDVGDVLGTCESTEEGLSTTKVVEVKSGEMVLANAATPEANMVSKGDHTKVANGNTGESGTTNFIVTKSESNQPTLGEILNPQYLQNLEAAKGSTGNPTSKKKKRDQVKNINPDLGDILSNRESTQEGLCTTKVFEVKSGDTVLAKTATPDANMVSKGDHTEVANGKMRETEITNINVSFKEKKKEQKSKNKRPTLGEILNPQNLKAAKGETGSGTTSTDNPTSKKQKRQKLNKNPDLGDILSTRENTQEGLSTTKVREMVLAETGSPDANMMSKGDHIEVADGKMGESETTNINVNEKEKNKKKPRSKNKRPTLCDILNPQNLEAAKGETGSATTLTDNPASKKQKRQKLNKNPDLGDILSIPEGTREGLSITKVFEVKSGEMVLAETRNPDANMVSNGDHTEVASGKMGESETTNLNANVKVASGTLGEILNPQNLEAAKGEAGSGTTSTGNPASKSRKRKKIKNNNPDLGDILSTHANTQEGSSTNKTLELKSGETVYGKTATPNANMVSTRDHTEVVNGKMGVSETTKLNVNGKDDKGKMWKSNNNRPTLGEILNPQYIELLEASDRARIKYLKKGKSQDTKIMGKVSGIDGKKCLSTIGNAESTMLKSIVCPRVANSELARKEITQVASLGKKLVILDVNGLLADVASLRPANVKAKNYIRKRTIFKRPYLDDFLTFCFERFNVGIWSSRHMKNLKPVVDYLLGDLKKKLLFLWDGSKCTYSGVGSLEVKSKSIVVKDLRKIWNKDGPYNAWVKGTFHESNTLLVDDSPYKALLNPKHTGIFPASYSYKIKNDNFLGPKGDFQTYLEGLAAADDVKTYVEQHPFGQGAIDEQNPHWDFYSYVLDRLNGGNRNRERELLARSKCKI